MKKFLGVDKTPPALERYFNAATKLNRELPTNLEMRGILLEELSSLADDIYIKTRKASQNTDLDDLDMREFLGTD